MDYSVAIKTGDKEHAGTNARVYITLNGSSGHTPEIRLDHPNYNDFKRNTRDEFNISTIDVGELQSVRLRHDNSGRGPGWHVGNVLVIRGSDGASWEANPNMWLAVNVGDGRIDRTFDVGPTNASFQLKTVIARLVNENQSERVAFYVDPRHRGIVITLRDNATSALVEHGAAWWFLGNGTHTLPGGGEYVVSVGGYAGLGAPLPSVQVGYSRLI